MQFLVHLVAFAKRRSARKTAPQPTSRAPRPALPVDKLEPAMAAAGAGSRLAKSLEAQNKRRNS
jgi:hypothetical protein